MKKIARKSLYGLFLILLVTAMLLMMAGPLYADSEKTLTITKILTDGGDGTFTFQVYSWSAQYQREDDGIFTVVVVNGVGTVTGSVHAGWPHVEVTELNADAYIVNYGVGVTHECGGNAAITVTNTPKTTGISLTKIANPTSITQGVLSTITYTYTVTNTGSGELTNVNVVDAPLGTVTLGSNTLASGASTTGTLSLTVTPATTDNIVNTAVATGTPNPTGSDVTASASATVTVIPSVPTPGISLTKIANPTAITQGVPSTITYTYIVTNTGSGELTNVNVVDTPLGTVTLGSNTLVSGAGTTGTLSLTVTPATTDNIVNTAVATGTPNPTGSDVTASASATVTVIPSPGPGVYNLWASTEGPGSITNPGLFVISAGQSLNYLMTPDGGGASIADVLVNGVSVGAVSSYTFANVNSNQTIHAIFSGGGGAAGVTVAALTEEGTIEVLALTGNNMLFYIIGFALMAIGVAFGSFFLSKTLRKRAN